MTANEDEGRSDGGSSDQSGKWAFARSEKPWPETGVATLINSWLDQGGREEAIEVSNPVVAATASRVAWPKSVRCSESGPNLWLC